MTEIIKPLYCKRADFNYEFFVDILKKLLNNLI